MSMKMLHYSLSVLLLLSLSLASGNAQADDALFSANLYTKFQAKACTNCHDFYDQEKDGRSFNTHAKRLDVNRCATCHTTAVNGFAHVEEWFAVPGLYTSGMDAKTTCEKIKEVLHFEFKSDTLRAAQMKKHLLTDPRVLWGIEGATPQSGNLPFHKKEAGMVTGGMEEWTAQVSAWIDGGMKCE